MKLDKEEDLYTDDYETCVVIKRKISHAKFREVFGIDENETDITLMYGSHDKIYAIESKRQLTKEEKERRYGKREPVDFNKPIKTRMGEDVIIWSTTARGNRNYPVRGEFNRHVGDNWQEGMWTAEGYWGLGDKPEPHDLVNVEEESR